MNRERERERGQPLPLVSPSQRTIQASINEVGNYPSFWPKPEPGTVEMPVASKSLRQ